MTRKDVIDILGHILVGAPHDDANEALAQAMDLLGEDHSGDATEMVPRSEDEIRAEFEAWATQPPLEWHLVRWPLNNSPKWWPGQYQRYHVQAAWEAWLTATRAAERRQG